MCGRGERGGQTYFSSHQPRLCLTRLPLLTLQDGIRSVVIRLRAYRRPLANYSSAVGAQTFPRWPPFLLTGRAVHGSCTRPWHWSTPSAVKNGCGRRAYMQHKYLWRTQETTPHRQLAGIRTTRPSFLIYYPRRGCQRFNPLRELLFFFPPRFFFHGTLLIFKGYIPSALPASCPCSCFRWYAPNEVRAAAVDMLWFSSNSFAASGCTRGVARVISGRRVFGVTSWLEKRLRRLRRLCVSRSWFTLVKSHCYVSLFR